ncbi:penicillin acylase family protein [Anditalea andensis]|uniref:PbsX family transcriptional regulator n=1 Tax=Anditalea andensis TaxID=1048983 RepID=A0A074KX00_9BACT|nr:penicillin acylase family protein [Anditalea andensis]KEO74511.1 PbsX family transcriptional regulator [Anditalea andensis]
MKYVVFLISLASTLGLAIALSINFGQTPPLGLLLDPFHGIWQNAYSEDEVYQDEIRMRNITSDITVQYDKHLIPHIFAQNEADLYRAQGYVTAQHRLWQMEFQTMAAAGRVSEIVGSRAIDFDRMQRRKGLGYGAEAGLHELHLNDTVSLKWIEAYSDGINQYINSLNYADLPVEYKLLNYRPEPWTAYKTVLLLKYMADMLVGDKDIEYTNMRSLIGEEWMADLFPDLPENVDPVIENDRKWDFTPLQVERPQNLNYPNEAILIEPLPDHEPGIGSNNWAVAGSKTESGNALLANDPHLSLNLPSLWYIMQLSTPTYTVKGATLPGSLGIISGFNEHIAWGVTNATRDVRDWYSISFRGEDRTEYLYNDQWINSSLKLEEIKVKGQSSFIDSVIYTHYGPVVYDKNFRSDNQLTNFALKWTAHMGSNEQLTFIKLNSAKNHQDYLDALDHFTSPAQNFVFASTTGDIAMKVQGRFPLKWDQQGKYIMDGSDPVYEWQEFIPSAHNPSTLNPNRGFVSSANQHSVDNSYPYYVFDNSFEHYRNRRINRQLEQMSKITIEDMKNLQFDNYHLHAAEALPVMLQYVLDDSADVNIQGVEEIIHLLQTWDYFTHPDQKAPPIFEIWWKNFEHMAWNKWKINNRPTVLPNKYQTTVLMQQNPNHEAFNDPSTDRVENAGLLVRESFQKTVSDYTAWISEEAGDTWSDYKQTSIQHLIPNFKSFSFEKIETGGGRGMINATSERHGASWRMVVELGEKINAYGIYPGGQSGNPGSKYYDNFIDRWAIGDYLNVDLRDQNQKGDLLFSTTFKSN